MADPCKIDITDCYPIELHYVKALFAQNQYRQCIQACRDVVKLAGGSLDQHPLQQTFISLYLGLAHDALARLMHHNSIAKLPAFNAAEQNYMDALEALPPPNEAAALIYLRKLDIQRRDEDHEEDEQSEFTMSPRVAARDSFDLLSPRASSPTLFSPPRSRSMSLQSPSGTPRTLSSDLDDLESHDSFSELLTPKRLLQRDFSRMSLLDEPSAKKSLPRDISKISLLDAPSPKQSKALSHGLMRGIRPGDTPKQYYVPPRLPYSGTGAHLRSKLPRLASHPKAEPSLSSPQSRASSPRPRSPVSPLSQKDADFDLSDASTISAESPRTPVRSGRLDSSIYITANEGSLDVATTLRLQDHLKALAEQLRTHVDQVQKSKQQLLVLQAEKRAARKMPTTGTPLAPIAADKNSFSSPVQSTATPIKTEGLSKARSYWSFVPQDVKTAEKRKRIQDGKARNWERKRFDPTKYQKLCERALEEL